MLPERLEDYRTRLLTTPEVRSSVPLEGTWSYPIPAIKKGQVYLRYLIYSTDLTPEKSIVKFYPPFKYVEATIDTSPKVIVTRIRKPDEHARPLGETPPLAIRGISYEEVEQLDIEFYSVIEKMLSFVGQQKIYQQDADVVKEYRKYFDLLVEPEMQIEYRKISPEFFQWLDRVPDD